MDKAFLAEQAVAPLLQGPMQAAEAVNQIGASPKMLRVKYGTDSIPRPLATVSIAGRTREIEQYCQQWLSPIQADCGSTGLETKSVAGQMVSTVSGS